MSESSHVNETDVSPEQLLYLGAVHRLCNWAALFVGRIVGSLTSVEPRALALRDMAEQLLLLRAENSALTGLLLEKGILSHDELRAAVTTEAIDLDMQHRQLFPGFMSTDDGLQVVEDPEHAGRRAAAEMMKDFPH